MGIYSKGDVFGIKIYNFNDEENSNILFEKTYNSIINDDQKKEVFSFYSGLENKNGIFFRIYTECSTTHEIHHANYMTWLPITLDTFMEKFGGI